MVISPTLLAGSDQVFFGWDLTNKIGFHQNLSIKDADFHWSSDKLGNKNKLLMKPWMGWNWPSQFQKMQGILVPGDA